MVQTALDMDYLTFYFAQQLFIRKLQMCVMSVERIQDSRYSVLNTCRIEFFSRRFIDHSEKDLGRLSTNCYYQRQKHVSCKRKIIDLFYAH